MASQSGQNEPIQVWSEKGSDWFKVFSGTSGGEDIYGSACTKCFRYFTKPRKHQCTSLPPDGIIMVNGRSPRRLKDLCCGMASTANTESQYNAGIFGPNSWTGSPSSGISEMFFFLMIKCGRPVSYVIYSKLNEGSHITHHTFTVPYERRKGYMVELLRYSLPQIGETESTILRRTPIEKNMVKLWRDKFGVNIKEPSFHRHWVRFSKSVDQ